MIIKQFSRNYFLFQFSENEHRSIHAKQLIDNMKNLIPPNARKWFPEEKAWRIHISFFMTFKDLLVIYLEQEVFNQTDLFFNDYK